MWGKMYPIGGDFAGTFGPLQGVPDTDVGDIVVKYIYIFLGYSK
jgi:hypothetical protein